MGFVFVSHPFLLLLLLLCTHFPHPFSPSIELSPLCLDRWEMCAVAWCKEEGEGKEGEGVARKDLEINPYPSSHATEPSSSSGGKKEKAMKDAEREESGKRGGRRNCTKSALDLCPASPCLWEIARWLVAAKRREECGDPFPERDPSNHSPSSSFLPTL